MSHTAKDYLIKESPIFSFAKSQESKYYKVLYTESPPPHSISNLKYIRVSAFTVYYPLSPPLYIDIKKNY